MSLIWGDSNPSIVECTSCQKLRPEESKSPSIYNPKLSNNVQHSLKDINRFNKISDVQLASKK